MALAFRLAFILSVSLFCLNSLLGRLKMELMQLQNLFSFDSLPLHVLQEDEFTYYDRLDYEWSPEPSSLSKPQPKLTSATGVVRKFQGFASEFAYAIQSCRDNQCIECILAVSKLLFLLQHKRRVAWSIKRWLEKAAESSPMEPLSKRTRPVLHHAVGWPATLLCF
ncbi:hypothetical protein V6N12_067210 [Hibiscus sabdariffa]|uniref:Uncharacterized protein n=1 Tax=Hibiscus sabdariffa TaxID=183260 RepID=A0ABR2BFN9_9ROSI